MKKTTSIVLGALFLAIAFILPFFTAQIPSIGSMLLPMHLPILICGFVLGWKYGLLIGFITPLIRSAIFTMPPMFPTAIAMAFELAAYGCIAGFLYTTLKEKQSSSILSIFLSLLGAMIGGRIVWGLVTMLLLSFTGGSFTFSLFMAGAFINAIPGIVLQIIIIPAIIFALEKSGYLNHV